MGYDSPKVSLKTQGLAGAYSGREWVYIDTGGESDAGTYAAAGYFTDAKQLGMKVGDRVSIYNAVTKVWQHGRMVTVQDTGATTGTWTDDTGQ